MSIESFGFLVGGEYRTRTDLRFLAKDSSLNMTLANSQTERDGREVKNPQRVRQPHTKGSGTASTHSPSVSPSLSSSRAKFSATIIMIPTANAMQA